MAETGWLDYHWEHSWGAPPHTGNVDQCTLRVDWQLNLVFDEDFMGLTAYAKDFKWKARQGEAQPWTTYPQFIDTALIGWTKGVNDSTVQYPETHLTSWGGPTPPQLGPDQKEDFQKVYDEYAEVFNQSFVENDIMEGAFLRDDALYKAASFAGDGERFVTILDNTGKNTWGGPVSFNKTYSKRFKCPNDDGIWPATFKLFREFTRWTPEDHPQSTGWADTIFDLKWPPDGMDIEALTRYFPWAIRKGGTWESCNRPGEGALDGRAGQLEIRKGSSWRNVTNCVRGYDDAGNPEPQYGQHYRGGWKRQLITGANG